MEYRCCRAFVLFTLVLNACGGGGDEEPLPTPEGIARIEVSPAGGLLLTGQDVPLELVAYDADGQVLETSFEISSSDPSITASADGVLSASSVGSALVSVSAGEVSTSYVFYAAQPAADASMVGADDVLDGPTPESMSERLQVGSRLSVLLRNDVSAGTVLLGLGDVEIAGVVVSSEAEGEGFRVVYEMRPLSELFAEIDVQQTVALAPEQIILSEETASHYDLEVQEDGSLRFVRHTDLPSSLTLYNEPWLPSNSPLATYGPFRCASRGNVVPELPFEVSSLPDEIVYDPSLDFTVDTSGLVRITGGMRARFHLNSQLTGELTSTAYCEAELYEYELPVAGPLSVFFGGRFSMGVGFELSGLIEVTELGFEINGEASVNVDMGVDCRSGGSCEWIGDLEDMSDGTLHLTGPDSADENTSLRVRPVQSLYLYGDLWFGNDLEVLRLAVLRARASIGMQGEFLLRLTQLIVPNAVARFDIFVEGLIESGPDVDKFLQLLGHTGQAFRVSDKEILASSAFADLVSAPGPNQCDVNLNPDSVDVPFFGYNIGEVYVIRFYLDGSGLPAFEIVDAELAAPGQVQFNMSWNPPTDGLETLSYVAMMDTKLATPGPFRFLELGDCNPQVVPLTILYVSGDSEHSSSEVVALSPDGSNVRVLKEGRLAAGTRLVSAGPLSPDGFSYYETELTDLGVTARRYRNTVNNLTLPKPGVMVMFPNTTGLLRTPGDVAPDGVTEYFAIVSSEGVAEVRRGGIWGNASEPLNLGLSGSTFEPRVSPDGQRLALCYSSTVGGEASTYIHDLVNGGTTLAFEGCVTDWHPDGAHFISSTNGEVFTSAGVSLGTVIPGTPSGAAISPNGTRFAYCNETGLNVIDADGQNDVLIRAGPCATPSWGGGLL